MKFRAWHPSVGMRTAEQMKADRLLLDFNGRVWFEGNIAEPAWKVMQAIGATDRHGVDIFEGDVLTWQYYREAVPSLTDFAKGYPLNGSPDENYAFSAVIGNIYDNPELLQQAESK